MLLVSSWLILPFPGPRIPRLIRSRRRASYGIGSSLSVWYRYAEVKFCAKSKARRRKVAVSRPGRSHLGVATSATRTVRPQGMAGDSISAATAITGAGIRGVSAQNTDLPDKDFGVCGKNHAV